MSKTKFRLLDALGTKEHCGDNVIGEIEHLSHAMFIGFEGYGDHDTADGFGCPVVIENQNGIPHVVIWADINKEDPTHVISLAGASLKKRKD